MILIDPLSAAPYKVAKGTDQHVRDWLKSHGWPIEIVPMTVAHAKFWDAEVTPTIKRMEVERLTGVREGIQPRADAYWKFTWERLIRIFGAVRHIPSGANLVSLNATTPQLWTVVAPGKGDEAKPIGMLLGLTGFELPKGGPAGEQHFTWMLTTGPDDYLLAAEIPPTLALGKVLIDTVIQVSLAAGCDGRVVLHADPNGGAGLLTFYKQSGMDTVDPAKVPRISATRPNDGRYFFLDEASAGGMSMTMQEFRRGRLGTLPIAAGPVKVA